MTCKKIPQSKDVRKSLLIFKTDGVDAQDNTQNACLGTWKFKQEVIKKSFAQMVITDELPFKFVEGVGSINSCLLHVHALKCPLNGL